MCGGGRLCVLVVCICKDVGNVIRFSVEYHSIPSVCFFDPV